MAFLDALREADARLDAGQLVSEIDAEEIVKMIGYEPLVISTGYGYAVPSSDPFADEDGD